MAKKVDKIVIFRALKVYVHFNKNLVRTFLNFITFFLTFFVRIEKNDKMYVQVYKNVRTFLNSTSSKNAKNGLFLSVHSYNPYIGVRKM